MKKISLQKIVFLLFVNCFLYTTSTAQTNYSSHKVVVSLTGTSTIHDWEMKAATGATKAEFNMNADNRITSLTKLSFTIPANSLKSGHNAMDKNTYKALKTNENPNISFVLTSATIVYKGANKYQFNCVGTMSIAGTEKKTDLVAIAIYNPLDKSLVVSGIKKMKMTDYNVTPPTVMMGAIKTGNDISIAYNLTFIK